MKKAYTLIEVLTISVLLAFFLVAFYEGSQRMAVATMSLQARNEALLQSRRIGEAWRNGVVISSTTSGYFFNGVAFTVAQATTQRGAAYGPTGRTLTRLALTLGWREIDPNSNGSRKQTISDVYFKY